MLWWSLKEVCDSMRFHDDDFLTSWLRVGSRALLLYFVLTPEAVFIVVH